MYYYTTINVMACCSWLKINWMKLNLSKIEVMLLCKGMYSEGLIASFA